jgi:hypothetical protein
MNHTNTNNNNNNNKPNTRQRRTPNHSCYCWTHGACAHEGRHCNRKADGHKDEATFADKMGGSTCHCNSCTANQSGNNWQGGTVESSTHRIINLKSNLDNSNSTSTVVPQSPNQSLIAKADSGASSHFFKPEHQHILRNLHQAKNPITVCLPNNTTIQSTNTGLLPDPTNLLSTSATKTNVFPDLQSSSLISLGQLCDDDCQIHLDKNKLTVTKNDNIIYTGTRNFTDGLWDINLTPSSIQQQANVIIRKDTTATDLVDYYHACCFSPHKQTFLRAINNGNFATWPGLTPRSVTWFMTKSIVTAKGHLDQERNFNQKMK